MLRACWDHGDYAEAALAVARLRHIAGAGDDHELVAEPRRWTVRLAAVP